MFPRVIPVLLVHDGYLVKPVRFRGNRYIGDPINAVRIFNEKQVDELVICDIGASPRRSGVNWRLIEDVASEAFMPVSYGGGITSADDARRIATIGIEKVILGTAVAARPSVITEVAQALGVSSTVVSIDARKKAFGRYETSTLRGRRPVGFTPVDAATRAEKLGAGEILLSSIDREGTFSGYDLDLIEQVSGAVGLPVIAHGGAGSLDDLADALHAGASAVAAGSMFTLNGRHRAVLITYPTPSEVRGLTRRAQDVS
jgi:cyclase